MGSLSPHQHITQNERTWNADAERRGATRTGEGGTEEAVNRTRERGTQNAERRLATRTGEGGTQEAVNTTRERGTENAERRRATRMGEGRCGREQENAERRTENGGEPLGGSLRGGLRGVGTR